VSVFGFLKAVCARCGATRGLYKIKDDEWLCLECLKEGDYIPLNAGVKTCEENKSEEKKGEP